MVQPASRRLLTEQQAADTYARKDTLAPAVAAEIPPAIAALPKGVVYTVRPAAGVTTQTGITLTAGRLYRVASTASAGLNAAVQGGVLVRGVAGSIAPTTTATPVSVGTVVGAKGTGTPNYVVTTTVGVFAVGTTGPYSFATHATPATGLNDAAAAPTVYTATPGQVLEFTLEDVGAVGAAGSGRVPAVTL
jgi:hypothetical protein